LEAVYDATVKKVLKIDEKFWEDDFSVRCFARLGVLLHNLYNETLANLDKKDLTNDEE
jgi:hypothetical protein